MILLSKLDAESIFSKLSAWLMQPAFVPSMIIFGILLRLAISLLFPLEQMSDSAWYVARATDIAMGLGYQEGGHPTAYWPVGWPAILAGAIKIFGSTSVSIIVLNLGSAFIIMLMILWLGRNIAGSEQAARLALLLYALYPNHIAYMANAATETVYTAVAMTGFVLLCSRHVRTSWLIASGLLFGLATLIKPQTIAFPFGVIIMLMILKPRLEWKLALKSCLIIYLALLAVVIPWSLRNQAVFGEFVLVSTNGGTALLIGANDLATGDHFDYQHTKIFKDLGVPWDERIERQVELDKKQKAEAVRWIEEHTLEYLAWMPIKVFKLWLKDTDGFWQVDYTYPSASILIKILQSLNQIYYALILLASFFCAILVLRALLIQSKMQRLGLLFCMPIFVSLLAAVFTGQIRYHFPAMPFLIVAAAWTFANIKLGVISAKNRD